MTDSKDILVGIIGLVATLYGTSKNDLVALLFGIVSIFLIIQLNLSEHDEEIKILKAQINTHLELKKIWGQMEELKDVIQKRKK